MISSPEAFLRLIRGVLSERLCGCGRWLRWVSIALFQVLVVCQPADATTYYVRKTGNDSNSGVTAASAYLTVGKAMSVAAAGDTVYIGKGTYTEKLTTSRAGTAGAKIMFVADTKGVYTGDAAGSIVFQYSSGTALSVLHGNIEFSGMYVQGSTSGVTSLDVSGATTTGVAFRSAFLRYGTVNTITVRLPLGLLGFESVLNRDYPVVFATLYIFSLIGVVVNLISDLTYTWIDPRIDFESREV